MMIPVYAINLDRSVDRWKRLREQAERLNINLTRVPAVDGSAIAPELREDVRHDRFRRFNGRSVLAGEYGCYRSHLKAIELFLASGAEAALVVEDDIELVPDLTARAAAILRAVPGAGVVKLINHRARWFIPKATTDLGDEIGRCLHGPQGSAACYLVTRAGAEKLLEAISIMEFPYDVAIERGWSTGLATYTVRENIVTLGPWKDVTEIADRRQYRAVKITGPRRIFTHVFRAVDYVRRIAYALRSIIRA